MSPTRHKALVVSLRERCPLYHILTCLICLSSAGLIASAEPGAPSEKLAEQQLTFRDVFSATPLRLVQATSDGFAVDGITGIAGTAIPVRIRLPSQIDENTGTRSNRRFLMFRGLPDGLTFSSGIRTRNVWIVAVKDIGDLMLNIPPNYEGNFAVEALLYQGETESPERQTISIDISPPNVAALPDDVVTHETPPDRPARVQPGDSLRALKEETELLSKGETHLRNGNVISARALFEELAVRGSARAAFAVAQIYDPVVLQQIGAVGISGDVEKAKSWYRKAAELGSIPPVDILSALKKDRQQERLVQEFLKWVNNPAMRDQIPK
jgi:hypothetical protein